MADGREILACLEGHGVVKTSRQTGNYMQVHCPFHSDGQEKKPSCGVLLTDETRAGKTTKAGFWHCFSCHYAQPMSKAVDDLIRMKDLPEDAVKWLRDNVDPPDDPDSFISDRLMGALMDKYAVSYIGSLTGNDKNYVSEDELLSLIHI